MSATVDTRQILQAHQLYCQLTGQNLRLDFVRERQWYDLLHQGFTVEQVRRVIVYLQREIREGRRNVGALKLSNLLQPDRFEEDLNIPPPALGTAAPRPFLQSAPAAVPRRTRTSPRSGIGKTASA